MRTERVVKETPMTPMYLLRRTGTPLSPIRMVYSQKQSRSRFHSKKRHISDEHDIRGQLHAS